MWLEDSELNFLNLKSVEKNKKKGVDISHYNFEADRTKQTQNAPN